MFVLKNDSSPGSDRLTTAWYKVFWNRIRETVYQALLYSYQTERLTRSQNQGIIKLLYKGKGKRNNLNNWRAISLTNTDYKIIAKTIANRLKKVIGLLIDEDQNGYIKGRNAAIVLRTLDDLIEHCNVKKYREH